MPATRRLGGTALGKAENPVGTHGLCSTEVQVLIRQGFGSQGMWGTAGCGLL